MYFPLESPITNMMTSLKVISTRSFPLNILVMGSYSMLVRRLNLKKTNKQLILHAIVTCTKSLGLQAIAAFAQHYAFNGAMVWSGNIVP